MKRKYLYKTCSLCKEQKDENRNPYCKCCSKKYSKNYRLQKKLQPNVNLENLGKFINKIEKNNYYIDLNEMNIIIFFYEIITQNINEYDSYSFGKQIKLMWKRINKFYNKRKSEINNI